MGSKANWHIEYPRGGDFWEVLISYQTPVAAYDKITGKHYRTDEWYSVTTTQHISHFLNGKQAETKPQSFFDQLVEGVCL